MSRPTGPAIIDQPNTPHATAGMLVRLVRTVDDPAHGCTHIRRTDQAYSIIADQVWCGGEWAPQLWPRLSSLLWSRTLTSASRF